EGEPSDRMQNALQMNNNIYKYIIIVDLRIPYDRVKILSEDHPKTTRTLIETSKILILAFPLRKRAAYRKWPYTGRAGGTSAPVRMRPEVRPTSHPEIKVPELDARDGFRDDEATGGPHAHRLRPRLHRRPEARPPGRRPDPGRMRADLHRYRRRGRGRADGPGAGPQLRPQGGHRRRLEARSPRPVAPPPRRDARRPPGAGDRVPEPPGEHRHDDQRRQAGLPRLRRPGRVRARPHPRADPGRARRGPGARPEGRAAAQARRQEA